MGALPTGYGKSLPMLVTGLLMPPGEYSLNIFNCSFLTEVFLERFYNPCNQPFDCLSPFAQQLISDCNLYGIDALAANQASERFNLEFIPAFLLLPHSCLQESLRQQ